MDKKVGDNVQFQRLTGQDNFPNHFVGYQGSTQPLSLHVGLIDLVNIKAFFQTGYGV